MKEISTYSTPDPTTESITNISLFSGRKLSIRALAEHISFMIPSVRKGIELTLEFCFLAVIFLYDLEITLFLSCAVWLRRLKSRNIKIFSKVSNTEPLYDVE